jgi:hypothetical protein
MPKQQTLNALDLKAAALIAQGKTEKEIFVACGKNRSWIQALKRRADFQKAVEEFRQNLKSVINNSVSSHVEADIEFTQEECKKQLRKYREQQQELGFQLVYGGVKLLKLVRNKIDTLTVADISPRDIPNYLKIVSVLFVTGSDMTATSLAVHKLLRIFDEIEKNEAEE